MVTLLPMTTRRRPQQENGLPEALPQAGKQFGGGNSDKNSYAGRTTTRRASGPYALTARLADASCAVAPTVGKSGYRRREQFAVTVLYERQNS